MANIQKDQDKNTTGQHTHIFKTKNDEQTRITTS